MNEISSVDYSRPIVPNILVVEDNEELWACIKRLIMLNIPKASFYWTTTGEEGKELIQEKKDYSLVIADWGLKGKMTGFDLWEYCEQYKPEIPFIVISGRGIDEFVKFAGKYKTPPSFLPKPFYPADFKYLINAHLHRRK